MKGRHNAAATTALALLWLLTCPFVAVQASSSGQISTPAAARTEGSSSSSSSASSSDGIPRSQAALHESNARWVQYPPWNPSRNITDDGFLRHAFVRIPGAWEKEVRLRTLHTLDAPCRIRQVPGDGNCLFHSISLCLQHAVNGTHWDMKQCLPALYEHSQQLRQQAVACLQDASRRLVLQGPEFVKSGELVQAAAQQYGLTAAEYCHDMEQEAVWGGGPEIVALANVLRRPIHVYELVTDESNQHFVLRRMACFGSPRFDRAAGAALHILSADSRFPDVQPGRQLVDGNHFLAVFPIVDDDDDDNDDEGGDAAKRRKRKRLRGGSFFWGNHHEHDDEDDLRPRRAKDHHPSAAPFRWMSGWWPKNRRQ